MTQFHMLTSPVACQLDKNACVPVPVFKVDGYKNSPNSRSDIYYGGAVD